MAETLEKNLDNMEEVTEGTTQSKTAVNAKAKPGDPIDTSKGGAPKVVDVNTDSMEGAKGTKNAGASASGAVKHEGSKSLSTKPSGASGKVETGMNRTEEVETDESEEIAETKYDFTQDVDALVAGEELSEEFRNRAATIFEAVVTEKVNAEVKALQEAFEESLTEEVEKIKTELAEKVDDYLSYAAESWMKRIVSK